MFFSALGWKSKGLKSKGHSKSKDFKALKGTKAKSYIHKGLTKRSAEPWWGHSLKGDWDSFKDSCWKGHSLKGKGHSLKGKCRVHVRLIEIIRNLSVDRIRGTIYPSLRLVPSGNFFLAFLLKKVRIL